MTLKFALRMYFGIARLCTCKRPTFTCCFFKLDSLKKRYLFAATLALKFAIKYYKALVQIILYIS